MRVISCYLILEILLEKNAVKLNCLAIQLRAAVAALGLLLVSQSALAATVSPPTPEGMLAHFESWIALGIVLLAFSTSYLLNHRLPAIRAIGTLLAALCCFGVVAWFSSVLNTGVLENPKPYQAPMDAAKPALLWAQVVCAFVAGIVLLVIANKQRIQGEVLELAVHNEGERYGRVSRVLHWFTAILFIAMIPMGIYSSMIPEDVWYRTEYNTVHKTIGLIVLGLLLLRLIWNKVSRRPSLDASLKPLERKLARIAHFLLYLLLLSVPVTGYVMTSIHGYPSYLFSLEIKPFIPASDAYKIWGLFHKYLLQYLVYLILGAHILGALKHRYIDKQNNAFSRMVS